MYNTGYNNNLTKWANTCIIPSVVALLMYSLSDDCQCVY